MTISKAGAGGFDVPLFLVLTIAPWRPPRFYEGHKVDQIYLFSDKALELMIDKWTDAANEILEVIKRHDLGLVEEIVAIRLAQRGSNAALAEITCPERFAAAFAIADQILSEEHSVPGHPKKAPPPSKL